MREGFRILTVVAGGAALGGLAAYLTLTAAGRHLTSHVNPALDDLSTLLLECRRALRQAQQVGRELRGVAADVQNVVKGQELSPA